MRWTLLGFLSAATLLSAPAWALDARDRQFGRIRRIALGRSDELFTTYRVAGNLTPGTPALLIGFGSVGGERQMTGVSVFADEVGEFQADLHAMKELKIESVHLIGLTGQTLATWAAPESDRLPSKSDRPGKGEIVILLPPQMVGGVHVTPSMQAGPKAD